MWMRGLPSSDEPTEGLRGVITMLLAFPLFLLLLLLGEGRIGLGGGCNPRTATKGLVLLFILLGLLGGLPFPFPFPFVVIGEGLLSLLLLLLLLLLVVEGGFTLLLLLLLLLFWILMVLLFF